MHSSHFDRYMSRAVSFFWYELGLKDQLVPQHSSHRIAGQFGVFLVCSCGVFNVKTRKGTEATEQRKGVYT